MVNVRQMDTSALTLRAQTIINEVLDNRNMMVYVINVDGSFVEIQPGCTFISMERYQMEIYERK